jgi:hypothetical protein
MIMENDKLKKLMDTLQVPEPDQKAREKTHKVAVEEFNRHQKAEEEKVKGSSRIRRLMEKSLRGGPIMRKHLVIAGTAMICMAIGVYFFVGNTTPTWAEVSERMGSISSYSGSYYIRDKGLFDTTKQYTFSDKTLNISIDYTKQLEFWVGHDNRIRLINGKKVTFVKKGGFFKTYDLHTRKESLPDITTVLFLQGNGYIDSIHEPFLNQQYNFGALFSGEIDETAVLVKTRKVISEDLVVFDVESIEGWKGQWRFRIWALRGSKLPIRILARNSYGSRTDIVFSYVNKQPIEFFDPEIFEAKLKDPQISLPDLMYMGLRENIGS